MTNPDNGLDGLNAERREELLAAYDEWLAYERMLLHVEFYGIGRAMRTIKFIPCTRAHSFHFSDYGEPEKPAPSTRAAAVLAAVGCDW